MIPEGETSPEEIQDLRPPDYWGRHVLTKVAIFGCLGAVIAGGRFVGDDGGTLLMGGGWIVMATLSLVGSIDHMRGLVSPLPGRDMKLLSPIAGIAWAAGFIALSLMALSSVAFGVTEGERPAWFIALGALGFGLLALGFMIQIGSLSDQWPDKWRPPYARQRPDDAPDASAADRESTGPSRADERP